MDNIDISKSLFAMTKEGEFYTAPISDPETRTYYRKSKLLLSLSGDTLSVQKSILISLSNATSRFIYHLEDLDEELPLLIGKHVKSDENPYEVLGIRIIGSADIVDVGIEKGANKLVCYTEFSPPDPLTKEGFVELSMKSVDNKPTLVVRSFGNKHYRRVILKEIP